MASIIALGPYSLICIKKMYFYVCYNIFDVNKTITIPNLGNFEIIQAIDAQDCVDPRIALPAEQIPEAVNAALPKSAIKDARHEGAVKSPGGSFGLIMSLGSAMPDIEPKKVVELVAWWERENGRRVAAHADTHAGAATWGCGHHDRALNEENAEAYKIASERVRALSDALLDEVGNGNVRIEMPVLGGDHQEKAVMIVDDEDATVIPRNGENEVFRYDRLRHEKNLKSLAAYVREKGYPGLTDEMLEEAATAQLNATLGLLAKGLPVYTVTFKDGEPKVESIGTV